MKEARCMKCSTIYTHIIPKVCRTCGAKGLVKPVRPKPPTREEESVMDHGIPFYGDGGL